MRRGSPTETVIYPDPITVGKAALRCFVTNGIARAAFSQMGAKLAPPERGNHTFTLTTIITMIIVVTIIIITIVTDYRPEG
jgi:hypothetical protein